MKPGVEYFQIHSLGDLYTLEMRVEGDAETGKVDDYKANKVSLQQFVQGPNLGANVLMHGPSTLMVFISTTGRRFISLHETI